MRRALRSVLFLGVWCSACDPSSVPTDAQVSDSGAIARDAASPDAYEPERDASSTADAQPAGDPLPAWDTATETHVRDLVARGRMRGNRHDVLAKIGDSITESRAFLFECGDGALHPGTHTELMGTVEYFTRNQLDADFFNSLTRGSQCAAGGWRVGDALDGGEQSALVMELDAIRPQWAVMMYGTNDLERADLATFRTDLGRAIDVIEARDVVPVLSTIPPRSDDAMLAGRVPDFNAVVRTVATERHLPWMDFHAALAPVPGYGLSGDGIHPSVYMEGSMRTCDLSAEAVVHGYNARNLLTLRTMERLRTLAP